MSWSSHVTKCHPQSSLADESSAAIAQICVPYCCTACACFLILRLRSFQFNSLPHGYQRPNSHYKKVLWDESGGFSIHQSSADVTLLLGSSLLNINISLSIHSYSMKYSIQTIASTAHHHLINQRAIYWSSCVAVDVNFNSLVFRHIQDFPLGQHFPHSTFPNHNHL